MIKILKNTLAVVTPTEKKEFSRLILLDIFISLVDILSIAFLLWIIQFYIQPEKNISIAFLPAWLTDKHSMMLIAAFVLLFAIKNWIGFLISKATLKFIGRVAVRISANNLASYQQAAFCEFIKTDSSAHVRTIAFQPFDLSQYMLAGIQQMVTQLSLITISIVAIILFNATLFLLLLLILLPPAFTSFYLIKKRQLIARTNIQQHNERSFQYLLDSLKGYVEANIYNRNDFFLQRFVGAREKFSTNLFDSLALQGLPNRIIEIFAVLGLFILIAIARWTGNNDSATLITIGAFMAAAYKIIPGIVKVINISGQMKAYSSSFHEITTDKKTIRQPAEQEQSEELSSIKFNNIDFNYGDQAVLKKLSFEICKGDFIGITGASGKGKTSIFNLLLGFLPAAKGNIFFNGKPVSNIEIKNYWPRIAYVRQQNFFIHDSLLRNITLEEKTSKEENLQYAVLYSGLEKIIAQFPEGPGKIITENGKNISGGQQQRVNIARALYKRAGLILLDEPFNELDDEAVHSLLKHFRELAETGTTVVMITHDKESLAYCNKIISLDEA
ncbi:ABC transporter ATP-binding protein [soil metagenome]